MDPLLLFVRGLNSVNVSDAAALNLVKPLTAALLGVPVLGERLSPFSLMGIPLLIGGVFLFSLDSRPLLGELVGRCNGLLRVS